MTCIVGLIDNGKVYIGADSAGASGYDLQIRKDQKIFRKGEFLIGFTSSFRMGQLLRFRFEPPDIPDNIDLHEYMIDYFIERVRCCLRSGGFAEISANKETYGVFLVGVRGRLFFIDSDLQVGEFYDGFHSVGCGASYALGSLLTSSGNPKDRILKALEAADHFSTGVSKPFELMEI